MDLQHSSTAKLRLRGGDEPLSAQLVWPGADARARAAMMVLLCEPEAARHAESICRSLARAPGILSLSAACRPGHEIEDGLRSIEWTADHAAQLGAKGARLVLAALEGGAPVAAALAIRARDAGWPDVMHQVFIHPQFRAGALPTAQPAGVAPATVIGDDEASRAYADRLRRAGVPVQHLHELRDVAARLAEVVRG